MVHGTLKLRERASFQVTSIVMVTTVQISSIQEMFPLIFGIVIDFPTVMVEITNILVE